MTDSEDEFKTFEVVFTILIAVAATLAGIATYLAAEASSEETYARQKGQILLNEANVHYLEEEQIYYRDVGLLTDAAVAQNKGETSVAQFLREQTSMYQNGYIDKNGNATAKFSGDYDAAFSAYFDDLFRPYNENYTASQESFRIAEEVGGNSSDYMLSTVLLTISTLFGTIGMSATRRNLRTILLALIVVFLIIPLVLIVLTATM